MAASTSCGRCIGGGSTEIILFKNKEVYYATSIPIGSLNLYVKYVKKIIPKESEREEIRKEVLSNLKGLEIKPEKYETIYGIGGSIRATRKLNNYINALPSDSIEINVHQIGEILRVIRNSKKETIKPILRNIPDRIHTIIPGLIILDTIADYFKSEQIVVSKYGIREGYLFDRIGNCEID
jgi:exopolyphosphatase/guanosine-5'-triphosphate,3'-diphosphate pyrophosphatase